MGWKEECIKRQAEYRIESLNEVKECLRDIIRVAARSNANMGYKRKIYRIVRDMCNLKCLQKYKEAEDTIALLKKIEFLLPSQVEHNLKAAKDILERDECIRKLDHKKAVERALKLPFPHPPEA